MTNRYFSECPIMGGNVVLTGQEAHHLVGVMRVRPGDRVEVFDGSGAEFSAEVERAERDQVALRVLERKPIDRELPLELVIGVCLPKGDRQRWLVEKAVELGVRRIVPLVTARSVAKPGPQATARLHRGVIEASKQCGRNRLMEIAPAMPWPEWVDATRTVPCRLLAHPGSGTGRKPGTPLSGSTAPQAVAMAIGPEGGFTDDEVRLAVEAGWQPIDLGPRILRIETAAIMLAALAITVGQAFQPDGC